MGSATEPGRVVQFFTYKITDMKTIFLLLFFPFTVLLNAQPSIQWQHAFGGNFDDHAYTVTNTIDGGYIIGGNAGSVSGDITQSLGGYDCWIVKTDSVGVLQWQKSLGGSMNDYCNAIRPTSDGGYILAGYTNSSDHDVTVNHGGFDCWVAKLDASGSILWQKSLGGSGDDEANSIQQTTDGGYIVGGWTKSTDGDVTNHKGNADFWVVKLDANGAIQWQKAMGGSLDDKANYVEETGTNGYIVAGSTASSNGDVTGHHNLNDFWIVKLDPQGTMQWQKCLGGAGADVANEIHRTADGGYIVAGSSASTDGDATGNHGLADFWIVKLDATGAIQWQKSAGGSLNDYANSIRQDNAGNYIALGYSTSNDGDVTGGHGNADFWIVKINPLGSLLWQKSIGGGSSDIGQELCFSSDGGYVVVGEASANGGDVSGNHGNADYWLVKLNFTTGTEDYAVQGTIKVAPNPVHSTVHLVTGDGTSIQTVSVIDILGRIRLRESGVDVRIIDLTTLPAGVYLLEGKTLEGKVLQQKIIKD
jgi:hypothetical protein